jgi:membrane-bound serine protease (ClpP class)
VLAAALASGPPAEAVIRAPGSPQASAPSVHRLVFDGAVHPASSELLLDAIRDAEAAGADALLVVLDTPGGLLDSTREAVKGILAAEVPVVVYVAPAGARAASAGVFLTLAAHVAAMAPGTNIGAAHPVGIGGRDLAPAAPGDDDAGRREGPARGEPQAGGTDDGETDDGEAEEGEAEDGTRPGPDAPAGEHGGGDLEAKAVNDAAAFARSLAARRGRNAEWAERSVRESVSATAEEALELGVVDLLADGERDLLRALDGRVVTLPSGSHAMRTADAAVTEVRKGLRFRVLDAIANPNVAFVLFLLGMYGLFFELANPGAIVPGVIGGISLLLALFAFQALPVNTVGLLLLALATVLFLAEIKVVSHGILTIGGAVAFLLGATLLFESPEPALRVSWAVILPALGLTVGFFVFALGAALRARRARPTTGREGIVGSVASVRTPLEPATGGSSEYRGKVALRGELWNAVSPEPAAAGERVEIVAADGLTLRVRPLR